MRVHGKAFRPRAGFESALLGLGLLISTSLSCLAGDLLRNGATANNARPSSASEASAAAAALARSNAQDALTRTTNALQAVQQMQATAQAAAAGKNHLLSGSGKPLPVVPNGMAPGGLNFTSGTGIASAPTQRGGAGRVEVVVKQTTQQAILNWSSFNIGQNTTLFFDQSAGGSQVGQWIAFNKVNDPTGVPSQILGSIVAAGQVYVINPNGIIFGGTSQVNVHTLVASSLPINDNLISRGLLNNPDAQFLFSALPIGAGSNGPTPAFTPTAAPSGQYGNVVVQAGAQLTSPATAANVGGRIALIGANVQNAGTISTPDGQTILAAGLQVGFAAHSTNDPSIRGLDVYVGQVGTYAGTATNSGLINAPEGNITITGKTVNQSGAIASNTSVSLNGSISLLANYGAISNTQYDPVARPNDPPFLFTQTGAVNIGAGSVMSIIPEYDSSDTIASATLPLRSQINIQGKTVYFAPNSTLLAESAVVNVDAGVWSLVNGPPPTSTFVHSGGQIYLDQNALIDVAGSIDVPVSSSQYILSVTLRGTELANSPLQRDSIFRDPNGNSPSITVDLRENGIYNGTYWVGTPLADLSGYLSLIQRGVGELTTAGGTVSLNAGGSIVVQSSAQVNVSGGWVNYSGGYVQTTRVLYDGHIMDIANATPDRVYQGIYTGTWTESHPHWGISYTYTDSLALTGGHYEEGYTSGADGGSLSLQASSMALDGTLTGVTVSGPRQRDTPPASSSLSISFQSQDLTPTLDYPLSSPTPPMVTFGNSTQTPVGPFALDSSGNPLPLRADRTSLVVLSPSLLSDQGFGQFTVLNPDGTIEVPAKVTLNAGALGSITMTAANLNVLGTLQAPGGTVNLTVYNISPSVANAINSSSSPTTPSSNTDRGVFTLAPGATISTAGLQVDDRLNSPTALTQPLVTQGGDVSITAYSANLSTGSLIDVSGGVAISALGKITYGNAGTITIKAGQDPTMPLVVGGQLTLNATLRGYSGAVGGSLVIQAPAIQIGGAPLSPYSLVLDSSFFDDGGFTNFSLTGLGIATSNEDQPVPGFYIAPGEVIEPVAQSIVAVLNPPGGGIGEMIVQKPVGIRSPVSLSFAASGVENAQTVQVRGDLVMGAGSIIRTDPLASVSLSGNTVAVLGSIYAPAGAITLTASKNSIPLFTNKDQGLVTLYIGPNSVLSAAGTVVYLPDAYGRRIGEVLPGGSISVTGNIVAAHGAVLDVSGTTGVLDLSPSVANPLVNYVVPASSGLTTPLYSLLTVPVQVDSSGGSISLTGGQMLFSDATLLGKAGGPTALGGSLSITSGRFYTADILDPPITDSNLVVKQGGPVIPSPLPSDGSAIGMPVTGAISRGYFSANVFENGGFDSLALNGVVQFTGPVNITARGTLSVASGGILYADSKVRLSAPYVILGTPFPTPALPEDHASQVPFTNVPPVYGSGSLIVEANHIDIGTLVLQDIGQATLAANGGDIQGDGTLTIAGNLTLRAAQVYAPTLGTFNVIAYDYNKNGSATSGSITVQGSGTAALPLSAEGTLNFYASIIKQDGTLRAPFGVINLGWDGLGTAPTDPVTAGALAFPVTKQLSLGPGSITSVSGVDPTTGVGIVVPYGISPDGTTWVDPRGVEITGTGPGQKSINLSASSLTMQGGATVDLQGGGDLLAFRWVSGVGGTTNILGAASAAWSSATAYTAGDLVTYKGVTYSARENNTGITPSISLVWTQVPQSYAIVPGYNADYSPFAPFNNSSSSNNLISGVGAGYVSSSLHVGDRIFVGPSATLTSGVYTLLPAQYSVLPGAVLVTPQSGKAIGTFELPDGSSLVSGYIFNDLNSSRVVPTIASRFELSSSAVTAQRAEYDLFYANAFFKQSAANLNIPVPALPQDSGYLLFEATQAMSIQGTVLSRPIGDGRGATIDINSPLNFVINDTGTGSASNTIYLGSSELTSFGADSLLIGGKRTFGTSGATVSVQTNSITVDNAGSVLSAGDVILTSTGAITLAPGATIASTGQLVDGAEALAVSGNGTLLRVSQDPSATIVRSGITSSVGPALTIGSGAQLSGASIILDSSELMQIAPTAQLSAESFTLDARRISLQLDNPGSLQADPGLILSSSLLAELETAQSLSLLSYSSIDIYGSGQVSGSLSSLSLNAAEIRGFNATQGSAQFTVANVLLGGSASATAPGIVSSTPGSLAFNASVIQLAAGSLAIDQYANVLLNASGGVIGEGTGSVMVQNALTIATPILTGAASANRSITAGGALTLNRAGTASVTGGLGSTLSVTGQNLTTFVPIVLPSGSLSLHSTAGDLTVGSLLDVSGVAQEFYDVFRYTSAGSVTLTSDLGNVVIGSSGMINASAQPIAGNAGSLTVSAPNGGFTLNGRLAGKGGAGGQNGVFSLDTNALATTSSLSAALTAASFTQSQTIRVRSGSVLVNGDAKASNFSLSVDQGGIEVATGAVIDASGVTGGSIFLSSNGNLVLDNQSILTVAALTFNDAGKGGSIDLEAGTERNGIVGTGRVSILTGSTINLSVASEVAGSATTPGSSAYQGQLSGTLHIRAAQNSTFTDVNVDPINGTIINPSSVLVEGYRLYDLTASGGTITTAIQTSIQTNSNSFLGANGTTSANYTNMMTRLLANNGGATGALGSVLVLAPGAEIINRTGGLTLGAANSTTTSDWNLSTFRFGAKGAPGVLTLRAAGNITFNNALSDGFTPTLANTNSSWLWLALPTAVNTALPLNTQSWSFRITAGADLTGASYQDVLPLSALGANGSILLGKSGGAMTATGGSNALTSSVIGAHTTSGGTGLYQVIRTGSGDIVINAGQNVELLNEFATIYTAGTRVQDPTLGGTFDVSSLNESQGTSNLGAAQQTYGMTFTEAGGNVTINAGTNIEMLAASSSRELPDNWLYRRGTIDANGQFQASGFGTAVASTAWWVDFSNFFEGIGALGGGNVTLNAGGSLTNVDAVVPTNARVSKGTASNPLAANQTLLELGGGDLTIKTGGDINGGVYYVERGTGTLTAGGQITTNSTRSPGLINTGTGANAVLDPSTWLPTTLFVGQGGFNVSAQGSVLLGPVANPFLIQPGLGNTFWLKTYFSTYGSDAYLNVQSLGGDVTFRESVDIGGTSLPLLEAWGLFEQGKGASSSANFQPWLRLSETTVAPFATVDALMPPVITATSFSGNINLQGNLTLFPSSTGTLELLTSGSINGLQPSGFQVIAGQGTVTTWTASTINVSDADPAAIPGISTPLSYQSLVGTSAPIASNTQQNFLSSIDIHFQESGGTNGSLTVLQKEESLHDSGPLHAGDDSPIRLYAGAGDISGLTLFAPKATQIFAGQDITDIAFYIQNVSADDGSIVASGRDMILYDANSALRLASNTTGNIATNPPLAGDIQISGPGSLEVLAGRNLDLGTGTANADGTGTGITSIGNARNPALPTTGAELFVAAGVGPSAGLGRSQLDFDSFIATYIDGPNGLAWLSEIQPGLTVASFDQLATEQKDQIALKVLYLVLRDTGRAHATSGTAYDEGYAAIATLFPLTSTGDIFTRSRDVRTKSGGDITIFAPSGALTLANSTIGNPLTPPGIITESGGNISIFTNGDVDLGIGRIFTLEGGNIIIWSSSGNIAAGASSKTVQSAPPTQVLVDPQSADVKTNLAGLATGGGIGVLATVAGIPPGNVDLIAPVGVVDAGDAGIRATGNLTIAATAVLNANNISVGGTSVGTPSAPVVVAPNISGLTSAANSAGAGTNAASEMMKQNTQSQTAPSTEEPPSIITVEVLGYGGSDESP